MGGGRGERSIEHLLYGALYKLCYLIFKKTWKVCSDYLSFTDGKAEVQKCLMICAGDNHRVMELENCRALGLWELGANLLSYTLNLLEPYLSIKGG